MAKGPVFCWECSRKLRWPHYIEKEIDGHLWRIHKECEDEKTVERKTRWLGNQETVEP